MNDNTEHTTSASFAAAREREADTSPKRECILEAATKVFLTAGFDAASMDMVAHEAGVSKQTIYNHFGSKEALFGAIIRHRCDSFLTPILTPETEAMGISAALSSLARQVIRMVLTPQSFTLYRVIIAEAQRFPELGKISYEAGAQRAVEVLAHFLEQQANKHALRISDSRLAAEQFFGLLNGHLQLRGLLGVDPQPDAQEINQRVEKTVECFLRLYGTGVTGGST